MNCCCRLPSLLPMRNSDEKELLIITFRVSSLVVVELFHISQESGWYCTV